MKRLFALVLALSLALSLAVFAHAEDEIEIPLDADHLTGSPDYFAPADALTFGDGTVNADNVEIIAFALPKNVTVGETVTVHIKGSADANFRVWLIGADVTANKGDHATFSNQWVAADNGFTSGEFDMYITLTAVDAEPIGGTEANKICFKAPAAHGILENLTVTHLSITYPSAEDTEAAAQAALEAVQEYIDQSEAALADAQSAGGDKAAIEAALSDAQAAADAIAASENANLPAVAEALDNARKVVSDIQALIKDADAQVVLDSLQSYIDIVNNALETAKNAGSDVAAVEAAFTEAHTAANHITEVANENGYDSVLAASRDARSVLKEISSLLEDSKELKAQEEADSANQPAADDESPKPLIAVAAILGGIACVLIVVSRVFGIIKKKKK